MIAANRPCRTSGSKALRSTSIACVLLPSSIGQDWPFGMPQFVSQHGSFRLHSEKIFFFS
jgi:hypothetical protein